MTAEGVNRELITRGLSVRVWTGLISELCQNAPKIFYFCMALYFLLSGLRSNHMYSKGNSAAVMHIFFQVTFFRNIVIL